MTFNPNIRDELAQATSVLDLAQRLGRVCLDKGRLLTDLTAAPTNVELRDQLEKPVAALDIEAFMGPGGFSHVLALNDIEDRLQLVEMQHPLEYLAFLRGLCSRVVPQFFKGTRDCIVLDRGMPIPFALRPLEKGAVSRTPHLETLHNGTLMEKLPVALYQHSASAAIRVELDHRARARLDELTSPATGRLPRVATLHPPIGKNGIASSRGTDTFFDVRPKQWDLEAVLRMLHKVADRAEIAVLPELSIPAGEVDAFGRALREARRSYPPLVIAGSAHVRRQDPVGGDEIRSNESRVYLDGHHIATHAKIHPFETDELGLTPQGEPLSEGITRESKTITVLSGHHTRLAVVICSDLVDSDIHGLLVAAGVNLLLVPSLTFEKGSFNGVICSVASHCQGVSVIVNADLDKYVRSPRARPFRVMVAVPRSDEREQSRSYPHWFGPRRSLGVIDLNVPLNGGLLRSRFRRAMRWL